MKFLLTGPTLLLLIFVVFCSVVPFHAGTRLQMPQPAVSVHHR